MPEEPEEAEKYKKEPKVEAPVTDEEDKLAIGKAKVLLRVFLTWTCDLQQLPVHIIIEAPY